MTPSQGKALVSEILRRPLCELGFKEHNRLCFSQGDDSQRNTFAIGGTPRPDGGFHFGCIVGSWHRALQPFLAPGEPPDKIIPCIVTSLQFLRPDKSYHPFIIFGPDDVLSVRAAVLRDLDSYAIPFWKRLRDLPTMIRSLQDEAFCREAHLNPEERIVVLAAGLFLQGERRQAIDLLDAGIEERQHGLPPYRRRLQNVRERIAVAY